MSTKSFNYSVVPLTVGMDRRKTMDGAVLKPAILIGGAQNYN